MRASKNIDAKKHLRGESLYIDDVNINIGTLHGLVYDAPVAHAHLHQINIDKALELEGVAHIFTAKDIPGENQIGGIIPDEPLFAEDEIHYWGQPIAFIVADSLAIAKKARALIRIEYTELPVITTEDEAYEKGQFTNNPRTFSLGDTQAALADCAYVYEGTSYSNGQEHLYLETQASYAQPMENGNIKITSSTQGPTQVQKAAARVLGVAMHRIEVEVIRLGGGFGGKEDQATPWAVMTALAAHGLNKSIKFVLDRHDDLRMTGKRHPYKSYYKIGLDRDLKIKAFEAKYLQNAGAAADLSPAIAERTLFHATNSYYIENVQVNVYSCKTNLPPNTAFRGFGGPQGMFVIESAIAHAANELNIGKHHIQAANLLEEGDLFPYGQFAKGAEAKNSWKNAIEAFKFDQRLKEIQAFNETHVHYKKGVSIMPISFGISFTNTAMNHARALIHIYQDGSIGVSTGAVEMGQGVNTKMMQVAANCFSVNFDAVKIETTNTTRVANTSPSAASATADLNGKALLKACTQLKERLTKVAAEHFETEEADIIYKNETIIAISKNKSLEWKALIQKAFSQRVNLSEHAHYATPVIHFDKSVEKGHPFAYHVYGTAITTVQLDCIRGNYEIEAVQIVHDFGKSMNKYIDLGQIEGGLTQGIGWMTMEEIAYGENGRLLSNALSTYKVPDIFSAPKNVEVIALDTSGSELAIHKSKAVGEPPFMYGIGVYFAIQHAIKAFNPDHELVFHAPMTPEKVLMSLYSGVKRSGDL